MSSKRVRSHAAAHAVWLFLLLGTLTRPSWSAPPHQAKPPIPQVEFFGCTAIRDTAQEHVCMMTPEAELVLWVGASDCSNLVVSESGQQVKVEMYTIQGGCQLRSIGTTQQISPVFEVAHRLSGQVLWRMLIDRSKPRLLEWKRRIMSPPISDLEEVAEQLRRRASEQLEPEIAIDISCAFALAQIRLGNRDSAVRELGYLVQYAAATGYRSVAFDAAYRRADLLVHSGMHEEARVVLRTMAALATPGDSRSVTHLSWLEGLLDRAEEHFKDAAERIAQAMSAMERVQDRNFQRLVTPVLAELWVLLDRTREAERLLDTVELILEGANACERAMLLNGTAYTKLLIAEGQGGPSLAQPVRVGQHTVRELFMLSLDSRLKCKNDAALANVYTGLSNVEFNEGRYTNAQAWLARARALPGRSPLTDMGLLDVEARLAIAAGKGSEGRRLFKALDDLSLQNPNHFRQRTKCKVAVGTLEALRLLGQEESAVVDAVRSCIINQENLLVPAEVRYLTQRAKAAGLNDI